MESRAEPAGVATSEELTPAELALAARNHGMPLEALRHAITPVGLHYLLTHYDIPVVDPGAWRLTIGGRVSRPLSLGLDELRARPRSTSPVTMECAGNGRALLSPRPISQPWVVEAVGTGEWTGTPLRGLLEECGLLDDAVELVFGGLDRGMEDGVEQAYERSLPVEEALREDVLLAYGLNGLPLPPQHGFPVRLVVPGWYGMTNVKWLAAVTAVAEPFQGYQQAIAYRLLQSEDDPGTPLTRMMPRALMVPPGIPDFMSRRRFVPLGGCGLEGRAWSGWGSIEWVEVSADAGRSWRRAELEPDVSPTAWRGWSYEWRPREPGTYDLCCRARDTAGNEQPLDPTWNLKGYANNAVQRIPVTVLTD